MLDLLQDRSSFLETARRVKNPILVIYGAETPRRSKAEIEALETVPNGEFSSFNRESSPFMRSFQMLL